MMIDPCGGETHEVLGTSATIRLAGENSAGRLAAVEHTMPQDAGPPPHAHDREDELFYVLEGTFEFRLGTPPRSHLGSPGTLVHVPAGTMHAARATSQTARLLSIYSPAGGEEFFRAIDTIDQRDPDAVAALAARHGMSFPTEPEESA